VSKQDLHATIGIYDPVSLETSRVSALAQYYVFEWQRPLPEPDLEHLSITDLSFPKQIILSPCVLRTRFPSDSRGAINVDIRHSLSETR
jgi:hypothetical protein